MRRLAVATQGAQVPCAWIYLLVNCEDRTPVIAEVKIGRDGDAFLALVQALAGLIHLATPGQYARLRQRYPAARFPADGRPPPMDAYVICVDPDWRSGQREALLLTAKDIAAAVSASPRTAALVRRVTLLSGAPTGRGVAGRHPAVKPASGQSGHPGAAL